jgi:hypothetical protein
VLGGAFRLSLELIKRRQQVLRLIEGPLSREPALAENEVPSKQCAVHNNAGYQLL